MDNDHTEAVMSEGEDSVPSDQTELLNTSLSSPLSVQTSDHGWLHFVIAKLKKVS